METKDHSAWLQAIPRPGTITFYQYRIAELAANATEAGVKDQGEPWTKVYTHLLDAHEKAISELRKKHPNFGAISEIALEPVKEILKRHWKYAVRAGL